MKILKIFFALIFLTSCNLDVSENYEHGQVVEIAETEFIPKFSNKELVASGSSEFVQKGISNTRYASSNAIDENYNTAWCPHFIDDSPQLVIVFPKKVKLQDVRILSGLPKKDLLKSVEVYYDNELAPRAVLNFKNKLSIHIFKMPDVDVKELRLKIIDAYKITDYKSTCIPEIYFWEHTGEVAKVLNRGNLAATTISKMTVTFGETLTACGFLNEKLFSVSKTQDYIHYDSEWGSYYIYRPDNRYVLESLGGDLQMSAHLKGAKQGEEIEMKLTRKTWLWYNSVIDANIEEFEIIGNYELPVNFCYGSAFVVVDPEFVPKPFSVYRAEFYSEGRLIGLMDFSWIDN